jgi:hypothetical protein
LPVEIQFTSDDFIEVEEEQSIGMFKLAAMNDPQLDVEEAIKYQVLTDKTAMIGMVMQEDNSSGELKKIDTIQFGRRTVKTNEPELPPWGPPFSPGPQPRITSFSSGGFGPISRGVPLMKKIATTTPAIARATTPTPSATVKSDDKYDTLIDAAHMSGYWKESAEEDLKKFFEGGVIKDHAVEAGLSSVTDENKHKAYLTLVALHILEEEFPLREMEWTVIADKGKTYLKNVGVKNPNSLLKKFTLKFRSD